MSEINILILSYVCMSVCMYASFSLSLTIYLCVPPSLCFSLSASLALSLYLSLSLSLSLPLSLYLSLCVCIMYICMYVYVWILLQLYMDFVTHFLLCSPQSKVDWGSHHLSKPTHYATSAEAQTYTLVCGEKSQCTNSPGFESFLVLQESLDNVCDEERASAAGAGERGGGREDEGECYSCCQRAFARRFGILSSFNISLAQTQMSDKVYICHDIFFVL